MGKIRNEVETYTRNRGFRYHADYLSGTRVIYEGWSDAHNADSSATWQIVKHTYNASNRLTDSEWAQNSAGTPTDDFVHVWDNRASLTYGP